MSRVYKFYKLFGPFGRGTIPVKGLSITMVINHLLTWMILQVNGRNKLRVVRTR